MSQEFSAKKLDVTQFAKAAGNLQLDFRVTDFPRLLPDLTVVENPELAPWGVTCHWSGRWQPAANGGQQPWLEMALTACLPLTCQRCMDVMACQITAQRAFRFVATEAQAEQEDDDSEEDVLAVSRALSLVDLLEDELLMSLPLVPMHDVCPTQVVTQVADADIAETPVKANPFEVLAQLKNSKS